MNIILLIIATLFIVVVPYIVGKRVDPSMKDITGRWCAGYIYILWLAVIPTLIFGLYTLLNKLINTGITQ